MKIKSIVLNNPEGMFVGLQLAIVIQLIVIGILNMFQKQTKSILLGVFCFLAANSIIFYSNFAELKQHTVLYFFIGGSKNLFYGPILCLYLKSINNRKITNIIFKHLALPFCIYLLSLYSYYYIIDKDIKILVTFIDLISFSLLTIVYFLFGLREYKKNLKIKLNKKSKVRYLFFYYSSNIYLLTSVLLFIGYYIFFNLNRDFYDLISSYNSASFHIYISIPLFLIFCITLIVYGFTELKWVKRLIPNQNAFSGKEMKYNYIKLEEDLNNLFKNRQVFKDKNLTLEALAQKLGVKQKIIREHLKKVNDKNFSDFINEYRIEDFKSKIHKGMYKSYDLISLASESGFKSKASFYRAFKKHVGITPMEYIKKLN